MSTTEQKWPRAWEPLTPRGVAAFAAAPLRRLLLVQLSVAILAAGAVAWFLEISWLPIVRTAIRQLPPDGEIRDGQLDWHGASSVALAGNHFLGIGVDLNHSGQLGHEAQLQIEFGRKDIRISSMLGYQVVDYPPGWRMAFNRTELDPWWGAREPWLVASVAALTVAGLFISWFLLAMLYCIPVKLITLFENRDLSWGQSWRLAGAALMPGALFLTAGIIACGLNLIDLIQLGGIGILHIGIGWIYLFISPLFLPRPAAAAATKANPFAGEKAPSAPPSKKGPNPFKAD